MKVLVADDENASRRMLQDTLASWGFEVCAACDGAEAWRMMQCADPPALVVADWVMPGMDGLELARAIRARLGHLPIYIIIVTGRGSRENVVEVLGAGVDDYVLKPFDPQELRARLQVGVRLLELQGSLGKRVTELESALAERKRAEAELSYERDLLHTLMDNVPDCIFLKDAESRITTLNQASANLLGIKEPREAYGRTVFDFLGPEFARESYADERKIIQSGKPQLAKTEHVVRDGFSRWVTTTKIPIKDNNGRVTGIVGIARDITEWKEALDALHKSKESFRLLFSVIPHPVWVFDWETLEFLEVNEAAIRTYGYSREEFLRMRLTDIQAPDQTEELLKAIRLGGPPQHDLGVWKHQTKEGRLIDVEVSAHSFEFRGRTAVLGIGQDITERKRLEVELRQAQRLEAVGGLASGIAHEINTPIQYVGDNIRFLQDGFSSLQGLLAMYEQLRQAAAAQEVTSKLLSELNQTIERADLGYLTEEIPKSIAQSLDGVDRVATIVRAMKDFAHPGRKEKAAADLNKALGTALVVARNALKYVADVETDFGELPPVFCLLADLNQVFLNLLVNAADAIGEVVKKTGQKGRISIRTRSEGNTAVISISDTGGGIPENIQNRIFEPFFTTKEVGRGTGQGLAIARSVVVEKHGGMLTFETKIGEGTTFVIRLPVEPDPAAPHLEDAPQSAAD